MSFETFELFKKELNISIEPVILLIFGIFMLIFGVVLFKIHTGELPYSPDSTYGVFLVLVCIQIILTNKNPFEFSNNLLIVCICIIGAIIGMIACFIPSIMISMIQPIVGVFLFIGGISQILSLIFSKNKGRIWFYESKLLRNMTIVLSIVYIITIILGLITLFPVFANDYFTATFLIIIGISLFLSAYYIEKVNNLYPVSNEEMNKSRDNNEGRFSSSLFKKYTLSSSNTILITLAILLITLGFLLFPVLLGLIGFSPDGQLGLLLVITAIQIIAVGSTSFGDYKRSLTLVLVGVIFASMGIFACIVPNVLTSHIHLLIQLSEYQ